MNIQDGFFMCDFRTYSGDSEARGEQALGATPFEV